MSRTDVPDLAAIPFGSPESKAAARLLAEAKQSLTTVILEDEDGNPVWDRGVIYGPRYANLPATMTREEWLEAIKPYAIQHSATPEKQAEILAQREIRWRRAAANRALWRRAFAQLLREYHGRVPGSVAAARIRKGSVLEPTGATPRHKATKAQ
jgi:hypothetical protein